MTVKPLTAELSLRWMSFREHAEQIMLLRRQVYRDEQGFGEDVLASEHDEEGLHLGAFHREELISVISAYTYVPESEFRERYHLTQVPGRVVQYSKRVDKVESRRSRIGELLGASIFCAVYETLRPRLAFFFLKGVHKRLLAHYIETFGFKLQATVEEPDGAVAVMTIAEDNAMRESYLKSRKLREAAAERLGVRPPSLTRFLERRGRMDLVATDRLKSENLYTAPLSFQDELPRLSAQTRLLLAEQKSRINTVDFPKPPARLLDAGAGPGLYLSRLGQESKFKGYEFVGLDLSDAMLAYARLNRPDLRWISASIYDTGEPDQSYDVVHANFLFIHLLNPSLALREIYRILKPGGLLYVLDVNDSTFEGPPVISKLIEQHGDLCAGNRSILNLLPSIAKEHGFSLKYSFSTRAHNTASGHEPVHLDDELLLDRFVLWGIFSFIGQREELADVFKAAQEYYFASKCEISICIQTHVYKKE